MCFAPQRRALFRHLNFQRWSGAGVLCTFWLRSVLRATTACTFSTSQLPKVVRRWGVLYILTSERASRHNGVRFLDISTSKRGPSMVCFCTFWLRNVLRATTACNCSSLIWPDGSAPAALASLLIDPAEPQIIEKTLCFATFLPFRASASSSFWLFLFSDLLWSSLFYSPLLSDPFHLCFSSVHIVGSLTSKLPSITNLGLEFCTFWSANSLIPNAACFIHQLQGPGIQVLLHLPRSSTTASWEISTPDFWHGHF